VPTAASKKKKRSRAKDVDSPELLDRVFGEGCTRLAVISLHPGAGARTVVETMAVDFRKRGIRVGVTRVPRIDLDDGAARVTDVSLPEETIVATATSVLPDTVALEPLERVECGTPRGELSVCRVTQAGEIPVYAPDDATTLGAAVSRLETLSDGFVLVAGAWERRSFAAPEVAHAVVLAVGSSYSGTLEHSAAAVRYAAEILGLGRCDFPVDGGWHEAVQRRESLLLDRHGTVCDSIPPMSSDPTSTLAQCGDAPAAILVPDYLSDELLKPLARSTFRCTLVVKDATRVRISPVYYRAWSKNGGRLAVMEPMRLLAVATNPTSPTGPDANASEFRELVAEALPGTPVHDVPLESAAVNKPPKWKLWS